MDGMIYIGLFIFSAVFALGAFVFGHDADHDVDTDHGMDHGAVGPSIFSTRIISLFILGFSGMGIIAKYVWGLKPVWSSACGLGAGVAMGALAYVFMVILYREQASSMPEGCDYTGLDGRLTSGMSAGGTGEVGVVVRGQYKTVLAVNEAGDAMPEGALVRIVGMVGGTARVARAAAPAEQKL